MRRFAFSFILALLIAFFMGSSPVFATDQQCHQNSLGDVICPAGVNPYTAPDADNIGIQGAASGASIFGSGSPFSLVLGGNSNVFDNLALVFDNMSPTLRSPLLQRAFSILENGGDIGDIADLVTDFVVIEQALNAVVGASCGGGLSMNGDYLAYAQNSIAQSIAQSDDLSSISSQDILEQVCTDVIEAEAKRVAGGGIPTGEGGGGHSYPEIDADTEGAQRIAESAVNSIGNTTADNALTQGGSLGCALAVSRILDGAGFGIGEHVSTGVLFNKLDGDGRFEVVDTGHITAEDALNLQPGDVLVTKRGTRAGHTGVYIGNGQIVSNSSGGFQGSEKGTIQQNYTVDKWFGVTKRNPGGSAVFRLKA